MEQNVAIKIYKDSEMNNADREKAILQHIGGGEKDGQGNDRDDHSQPHKGKMHIAHLIDYFQHAGPNGSHACHVTKPLGPSLKTVAWCSVNETLDPVFAGPAKRQLKKATEYLDLNSVVGKKRERRGERQVG